ncbi:SDR family NAD(P)-dependent oxidoreductase [Cellulosilyticum ruminicola]|uniref:SDR family NAD(P)-dependent oxidoreductase n=1 Tax=Cellulosilyticum ruminicola TaxID=425254 RepID=UPI00278BF5B5|nr:SDR family NAD(P)-dependent oxidoreductase [Cellulosilyticum ruminicola]
MHLFYIIDKVKKWQHDYEKAVPRRAGVSSFGFGGTNAHLILEEAPVRNNQSNSEARYYMLVLSAKTQDALERQERQLLSWLEKHEEAALCDICTTLMIGREHFEERLAIVADSKEKVMETLRQLMNKEEYIEDTYMTQSVDGDKEGICYESIGDIQDVHSLKYKDLLKEVASFYVRGGKVDWSKLAIAKRINMPTYPFEKEKCWMPKVEYVEKAIAYEENLAYDTMADTSSVADVVSVVEKWELKDINLGEKDIKTILVVSEDCGISQELEKYIALAQKKVNVINANAYDQFKSSFKAIGQNFKNIDVVLYVTNGKALSDETQLIDMLRSIGNSGLQIGRMILAASYKTLLERCYIESWIALERTIQLILPKMQFNVLSIEEVAINKEEFSNILWKEMHNTIAQSVRYEAEGRKVRVIKEEQIIEEVQPVLKKHGVYVIIGGLGAIGQILAGYLAEKYDAKLILVGRRDQEEAQSKLEKAHLLTSNVLYDQTDICNVQELRQVIEEGKKNFGHIDGVMHIAGIEGKGNLLNNTVEDYKRVVLPKIKGTLALTECLKDESLDFICYFSSCSAIIGDFGSCDYAVGNRFMMNYGAYYKEQLHSKGSNTKIVVINWPLWRNGGMCNADQMASQMYLKSSGQVFLENKQGMRLFDLLLRQKEMSYTIFVGDRQRILTFLESKSKSRDKALDKGEKMQITEVIKDMVKESLIEDLKKIINRILRVPVEKLKLDKTLAEFGFDSVGLSEFADELSEYYSIRVTPDMFFSYPSIDKVAEYLISQYESQINQFYKKEVKEAPEEEESSIVSPKEESLENSNTLIDTDEIAVIGMSGRFPAARNIEDLWDILAQGKEVLQKMPSDRKEWHESEDNNVGVIPGVAEFDPLFFEILPIDAEKMDPKQRLLLQETWKALEDAGYNKKLLETEKIGMFVGVEEGDYISKDNDLVSNHNGILAARIGYLLNFSGPIMAINTACSSGLVALHQACQSIRNGECDTAVVAGANLMITPKGYENMKKIGMISKDGKCRAFDNRSQGMVPAEAIGVVVLKKKAKAQLDCHSIYATVIGSGINYDGKTNSITAPSGIAQANLLRDVYTRYHINPKDISYVVTHGTGTKLGDPIEVNALKEVFNGYTDNRQYCALTSTKPNIGHALAASGIVSFISLMLAMKEGIIPPTINCEEPNAYIEWQDSPFYLNRQRKAWTNNQRIGAVSAFGMSGTNAHVVAKNYIQPKETSNSNLAYALLVFSAKDEAVLEQNIENIITFMKDNEALDLASLSYSLLEGRMHFTYRYAIVANSVKQAIEMLTNRRSIKADTLVKSKQSMDLKASTQREINQLVEEISLEEDSCKEALCRLARLYGEGYEINGDKLFDQYAVRRLHIPTYVFLRENYWFEQKEQVREERQLHPLVHSNQSTLMKQCYKARFKKDNQVLQQIIGQEKSHSMIAYLEMINFAVKDALRDELDNNQQILIKDIKVLEDLELKNGALDIQIELQASDEDELAFNIYDQLEQKVYCQGNAQIVSSEEIGYEDLTKLKEQCTQEVNTEVLGMTKVYKGPSSILGKVEYAGQDTQEEALQIKPSILKQAFALVNYFEQDKVKTISIDACDISMISSNEVWIYINHIDSHSVNISLFGQDGAPYLRLSGYHYTKLEQIKESSNYKKISKLLMPQWTKIDTKGTKLNLENALVIGQTCDIPMNLLSQKMQIWDVDYTTSSIDDLALQLQKCNAIQHIIWFVSREHLRDSVSTQIVKQQEKGTLFLFRLTKALMQLGYHHQPLELTIVTYSTQKVLESDWFNPTHSGLHGLAQVIDKEIPHWHINVIDTDDASYNAINMSQEELVAYRNKQAYKKVFKEVKLENMTSDRKAYCKNGVYVVIGGAGGVGEVWSEYMIRTYQAQIIWIGRRKLNDQIREKITRLSALGPKIHYISADATCLDEMEAAYKEIKQIYPRVNGVVHSAVGALDKSVLHMDEQLYKTITQIKVDTSVYIARVFKDETLDFILYFSSIAAINKFAGQAGYVTGCVFEDAYAEYLDSLWQCKVKTINWGYWGTIGIGQAMPETFKTKLALSGIEAVMPTEAMQQLERFMDTKACQMAYECTSKLQEEEVESVEDCNARENIALQLKEIIGGYINIPASQIELDVDLEEYAIDSYMLDQLTDKLSQWFSQVDQQALLKYRTIGDMQSI